MKGWGRYEFVTFSGDLKGPDPALSIRKKLHKKTKVSGFGPFHKVKLHKKQKSPDSALSIR